MNAPNHNVATDFSFVVCTAVCCTIMLGFGATASAEDTGSADLMRTLDALIANRHELVGTSTVAASVRSVERTGERRRVLRRQPEVVSSAGVVEENERGDGDASSDEADAQEEPLPSFAFALPVTDVRVTSKYGMRRDPKRRKRRRMHKGVDFGGARGTPVMTTGPGRVIHAGRGLRGAGIAVVIEHKNGWVSRYFHLSKALVKKGDSVTAGQKIGKVGSTGRSTGPHLHFEIRWKGHPADPMKLMGKTCEDARKPKSAL